jgi:hypothetical protein
MKRLYELDEQSYDLLCRSQLLQTFCPEMYRELIEHVKRIEITSAVIISSLFAAREYAMPNRWEKYPVARPVFSHLIKYRENTVPPS